MRTALRVLLLVAAALVLVGVLFTWVFPAVEERFVTDPVIDTRQSSR